MVCPSTQDKPTSAVMKAWVPFILTIKFETNDTSEPLTGYETIAQIRDNIGGAILGEWVDSDPEVVRDDAGGIYQLKLSGETTAAFNFKVGYLDVLFRNTTTGVELRSGMAMITYYRGASQWPT